MIHVKMALIGVLFIKYNDNFVDMILTIEMSETYPNIGETKGLLALIQIEISHTTMKKIVVLGLWPGLYYLINTHQKK